MPRALIEETCDKHGIERDTLTLHSDRGSPMRAKTTAELFVDLGRGRQLLAPAGLERQPVLGGAVQDAEVPARVPRALRGPRACPSAPSQVLRLVQRRASSQRDRLHDPGGGALRSRRAIDAQRRRVLQAAYAAHPERFKGRLPTPPALPEIVGINLPKTQSTETTDDLTTTPALLTNSENQVSQSH